MTSADLKDNDWWERYFAVGGDWESMGGRRQTRTFAEHFIRRSGLSADQAFSLLDAGCALGDALALFAAAYSKAQLHGIDFSATAVARCREALGENVQLACGDLTAITGQYDAIYCSNTLEHFADFEERARQLLAHCCRLFVMVPFHELREGRPLRPDPIQHHQHTFERDSFDFLLREGLASRIDASVFACPGAWGWSPPQHAIQGLKNLARLALGRPWVQAPYQVLYTIEAAAVPRR